MDYSVNQLAKLAGVSARTLHYYDEIGLLSPARISSNGYRVYGQKEVNLLQQILFYRELGVPLNEIKQLVKESHNDEITILQSHLAGLEAKKDQINTLITNVERTISAAKGMITMSDEEKFAGFKQKMLDENEKKYGREIREKYGEEVVEASNSRIMGMTAEQYTEVQEISRQLNDMLKSALELGDPASEIAQKACELHKQWLGYYGTPYTKEIHLNLAQMYVDDPRFKAYYEAIAPGCAEFLRDAIRVYCA